VRVKSPAGYFDAVPMEEQISGNEEQQLNELSNALQGTQLQERRMSQFAFEPVSLPASRVRLSLFPSILSKSRKIEKEATEQLAECNVDGNILSSMANYLFFSPSISAGMGFYPASCMGGIPHYALIEGPAEYTPHSCLFTLNYEALFLEPLLSYASKDTN
jgi:hypothetical protein